MSDIIKHDFGKEQREAARTFARLLKIAEDQETDILANPAKYIDMASQRITEYELFIQRLWEALRLPHMMQAPNAPIVPQERLEPQRLETVVIDHRDYEAFQAVKALINSRR